MSNNNQTISRNYLSCALEDFIRSGVSAVASSADYRCIPSSCKAMACEADVQRQMLSIFFNAAHADTLLQDIRKTGRIALAICDPTSHKTIQLKGTNATQGVVSQNDLDRVKANILLFTQKIVRLGFDEQYCTAAFDIGVDFDTQDIVSVCFTPNALYEQSPGPEAGKLLESGN